MTSMQLALSSALKHSQLKKSPQTKLIWLWLKDHPDKTSREISTALNIPNGSISSLLHTLVLRGMVTSTKSFDVRMHKSLMRFRTAANMPEYTWLPLPKKSPESKPSEKEATTSTAVASQTLVVEKPQDTVSTILSTLTLREAQVLYAELSKIFSK